MAGKLYGAIVLDQAPGQIFASYTKRDRDRVGSIVDMLIGRGFDVWMDEYRIKGGQDWNFEILRALDASQIIILFISNNSVDKRGYVQRELKLALKKAEEKLIDDIYIIPVMLDDDTKIPEQVKGIQVVRASDANFADNIIDSIRQQLGRLHDFPADVGSSLEVEWTFRNNHDSQDGLPGYEIDTRLIDVRSAKYKNLSEIGEVIRGSITRHVMNMRRDSVAPDVERYNFGQDKFRRTNTFEAQCSEPKIVGRIISIQYTIHTYHAGAAHPNFFFQTFCFFLNPLFQITSLEEIFRFGTDVLSIIKADIKRQLLDVQFGDDPNFRLDEDPIDRGIADWKNLQNFIFTEEGIEFLFSPYEVAGYAAGPQFASVSYKLLIEHMTDEFRSALDLYWQGK